MKTPSNFEGNIPVVPPVSKKKIILEPHQN
jgi:hypothetical protein